MNGDGTPGTFGSPRSRNAGSPIPRSPEERCSPPSSPGSEDGGSRPALSTSASIGTISRWEVSASRRTRRRTSASSSSPPAVGPRYRVLFHEVGHALSSRSIRQPTSHLLRWHEGIPGFAGLAEGEGRFFEQIASSERWLRERPGLPSEHREAAIENERRAPLQTLAWLAGWVQQELTLYLHPDRDPVESGVRFARRLFGYDRYRGPPFANSFVVEAPLYSPSYVYAELLRPALNAALREEVGGELWPNARVGPWLVRHWFRDGTSFDWWTRLRELTGRPFGAGPFNAEMRKFTE